MDIKKVGAFIAELRKEKGLTQLQLAEALYITDKAVSKWERGLACPDISLLQSLAQILGVSVVELLNGEKADAVDVGAVLQSSIETYVEENKKVRIKRFVAIMMVLALVIGGVLLRHGMRLAEETRVELQCVCDNVNHRLPEILTAVLEAEEPFENTAEYISLKTSIDSEWRTIIELQFLLDYDAETYKQCTELSRALTDISNVIHANTYIQNDKIKFTDEGKSLLGKAIEKLSDAYSKLEKELEKMGVGFV